MKKILVIDDEDPIRFLLADQLRRSGFAVESAEDGPSGLQRALLHAPDLILLDVMMPLMSGFEVCRRIRSHPELAHIPVIFLTASPTRDVKRKALEAGGSGFMAKPYNLGELIPRIQEAWGTQLSWG